MGYPAELLSDGEAIEFEMRPHWRALLAPLVVAVLVLLGIGVLASMGSWWGPSSVPPFVMLVAVVAALVVLAAYAIRPLASWYSTQYVFTDRRIIIRSGLVARDGRDVPLSKINNVSFRISPLGRVLNYGTLRIDSASGEELVIADVPNVEDIQREINRLQEQDDFRRRDLRQSDR